ncbi:Rieske (2Fe-2S) protein [Halovivax limisalsi]|uniref:Rieske (2Fe-2S) protein n=1 Tax=Halovivax limisalsi TaxID=1453760 RepID=UPI001FFD4ECD|nr:Rieske 2Fe-2S domain-containing protein [Halovivax limisalsi]
MTDGTRLTTVDTVHEEGSWLFTVRDSYGELDEVILVPCEDGVEGWINRCPHESQRLDVGRGAAIRDGEIVCPRHGSTFDSCAGDCDNGDAAGTRLVPVETTVEDGAVYLSDRSVSFANEGGIDAAETSPADDLDGDDDVPSSTSHIGF